VASKHTVKSDVILSAVRWCGYTEKPFCHCCYYSDIV